MHNGWHPTSWAGTGFHTSATNGHRSLQLTGMREAFQHPYHHRHESRRGESSTWFLFSPLFTWQICYSEVAVYCNTKGKIHNLRDPTCDFITSTDVRNNGTCLRKGWSGLAKSRRQTSCIKTHTCDITYMIVFVTMEHYEVSERQYWQYVTSQSE
jgi:hypothetical protein